MAGEDDKTRGTINNVGGKIKEGLGKLTDDPALEAEGRGDQAKGSIQKAVGNIKDAFSSTTKP